MAQHETKPQTAQSGAFDLREIVFAFYKGWYIVVLCTILAVWYGINSLHNATYLYTAYMEVTPPQGSDTNSATNRFTTIGALGAMAGGLPPLQNTTQFGLYVEFLKSHDLADELAKDPKIMHAVFQDQWDDGTQSWREPPPVPFQTEIIYPIREFFGLRPPVGWHPPDGEALQAYLMQYLNVAQDTFKPLVTIAFRFRDRDFAIGFLNSLTTTADDMLRRKAMLRTKLNIDYVSKQLNTVTIAEQRAALADTLSSEEKFAMSAGSGAPFAAEIFEKPWATSIPTEPQGRQVLTMAALLGVVIGGALSLAFRRLAEPFRLWFRTKLRIRSTIARAP